MQKSRQTDKRQTAKKIDRQTKRQTERQIDEKCRQTETEIKMTGSRKANRQTDRQAETVIKMTGRQKGR